MICDQMSAVRFAPADIFCYFMYQVALGQLLTACTGSSRRNCVKAKVMAFFIPSSHPGRGQEHTGGKTKKGSVNTSNASFSKINLLVGLWMIEQIGRAHV